MGLKISQYSNNNDTTKYIDDILLFLQ